MIFVALNPKEEGAAFIFFIKNERQEEKSMLEFLLYPLLSL